MPLSDHDHVLDESPRVMYMHIAAHGDAGKIARTIHDALAESKTPLGAPATPAAPSAADVDTMLGGEVNPVIRALRGHGIQVRRCTATCSTKARGRTSCTSGRATTR